MEYAMQNNFYNHCPQSSFNYKNNNSSSDKSNSSPPVILSATTLIDCGVHRMYDFYNDQEMMKRRWSNNGGFAALRMLEESSAEVTSSSNGLVLSAGLNMSPSSLDSADYVDSDLWPCNEALNAYNAHQNSVITTAHGCSPLSMQQNNIMPMSQNQTNQTVAAQNTHNNNNNNNNNNNSNNNNNNNNHMNGGITYATTSLGSVITERLNSYHGVAYNQAMNNGLGSLQTSPLSSLGSVGSSVHSQHSPTMLGNVGNMAAHLLPGHLNANHLNGNMKHAPRSESANSISSGRDDLSPSSSLNGYATNENCDAKKSKKGPAPRLQEELCLVCGDRASGYHYNALTCEGCKGFFRRSVTKNASYCCKFGHACEMDMYMRRKCQECRLKKCLAVGMRPECVVPETQCIIKRREKKAQKEKDKQQASPMSNSNDFVKKEILDLMSCEPPTHQTFPLLPDDVLAKCQARNIPPLTHNQLSVIYKLIWYQDGYEQPSEEDLKRIMSSPDEDETQHDMGFRHITEITILTVQLIVEFAKGLPAFTRIPQEDQITLLKACSSEVMMLRMARRYDYSTDSIFFANNRSYNRDTYKLAGVADNIEDLLHFCRQMYAMKVDNVEYALVTAIVIFSDRPGLEEAELVEAIQNYYIDTLRIYILNRHCGDPKSIIFFAKLLSILTELRTLGNQNAEMCFSLKLKNRKLPKFLEEIWDVHTIPPSVQSHIQTSNGQPTTNIQKPTLPESSTIQQQQQQQQQQNHHQQQQHSHTQHSHTHVLTHNSTLASTSAEAQQQQMLHNIKVESSPLAPTNMSLSSNGSPIGLNGSEYSDVSPGMPMMGMVIDQDNLMGGDSGTGTAA